MLVAWSQFLLSSAVIALAGYSLARNGDVIAEKTSLGGTWIGIILLATVTSLPELVTSLSAVVLASAPDIAVGDLLGSCVLNLALIALLDVLHRRAPLLQEASPGHILAAGFSSMLIGIVVLGSLAGDTASPRIGHIGIYTPAIVALYLVAVRSIYVHEQRSADAAAGHEKYAGITLRQAAIRYAIAAAVVVGAGIAMPFVAVRLAAEMGWGQTFVGTLLVAFATSLPEAASVIGALRIGALDLAIGNLLGSNLFNVLILAIGDLAHVRGPLLSQVSQSHAISGVSALIMTAIAIVGLHGRAATRVLGIASWASLALVLTFVLSSAMLFVRGH